MKEINLIPYHIKDKRLKKEKLIKIYLGLGLSVVLLVTGAYYPYVQINRLNIEATELKSQIDKQNEAKKENLRLKSQITPLKDYIDKVDNVKTNKFQVYDAVKNIEKYLPSDVVLVSLNYANNNITISGTCRNYHSTDELLANLQESKEYRNSSISNINDTSTSNQSSYAFTLRIDDVKVESK